MESSTELSNIIKRFKQDFSENWIENLIWDNDINSKNSHGIGLTKIQEFINFIFTELSKAILEGKFLYQSYDSAQTFCEELMDESDIENKNPFLLSMILILFIFLSLFQPITKKNVFQRC